MPLPRAPKSTVELTGGIVFFYDPHTHPHSIRRAVNVPGFAAAVGLHLKHAIRWNNRQVKAFRCLQSSPNTKALGEVGIDVTAKDVPKQEQVLHAFKLVSLILSHGQPIQLALFQWRSGHL
ncbi:hypothetical protein PoB_005168600 [Plakobranchus ocellatus]|uniref:Uncharacterized protein n=1 Tax=Plakobranchus ocellatus TaxID=259542 RepID=A0AAV4BPL4_9GAST|nr:hypothetical protein PoB_005168600 [Plakobranchus ocellatus]